MRNHTLILEGGECTYKSTITSKLAEEYSAVIHKRQRIVNPIQRVHRVLSDIVESHVRTSGFRDDRLHIFDRWELISDLVYEKYQYGGDSIFESLLPDLITELKNSDIVIVYLDVEEHDQLERFRARGDRLVNETQAIDTLKAYKTLFSDAGIPHYRIDTTGRSSDQVCEIIKSILEV